MIISVNTAKRIFKKLKARRMSKSAQIKLAKLIEDYGCKLAKSAIKNANYFGRKTIKEEDVKAEIGELLDKDERNIWTVYNRGKKK